MRLAWRPQPSPSRPLNIGVIAAVLLATLTAGLIGGFIVWAVWRYDVLQLSDHRGQP